MELDTSLLERFSNSTKVEHPQSALIFIQRGAGKSAHDYALRFKIVLEKIAKYEDSFIRDLFIGTAAPFGNPNE